MTDKSYPWWLHDDEGNLDRELADEFDEERDTLIQRIETAFADVPYPQTGKIIDKWDPDGIYGIEDLPEARERLEKSYPRTHWKNISFEVLARTAHALYMFTPKAYRFFLPGFMIAALLHPYERDIPLQVLFSFSGHGFHSWNYSARMKSLSDTQKEILLTFVKSWNFFWDDLGYWEYYWQEAIKKLELPP